MASREIIGHIDCPICRQPMEIKPDKNGHAYGHCPSVRTGCNGQVFTRNGERDALLRANMRPVTVTAPSTGTDDKAPPQVAPVAVAPPAPPSRAPAKAAQAVSKAPARPAKVATPEAPAAPKAGGWFSTLVG